MKSEVFRNRKVVGFATDVDFFLIKKHMYIYSAGIIIQSFLPPFVSESLLFEKH